MRTSGRFSFEHLLQVTGRKYTQSRADAANRRAIYKDTILWKSPNDGMAEARRVQSKPETCKAFDGTPWTTRDCTWETPHQGEQETQEIPLFAGRDYDR